MEHQVIFSSDIHGNEVQYAKLLDFVERQDAKTLILGGDLTPGHLAKEELIQAQRNFLRKKFKKLLERLRRKMPDLNIFVIMGNDDVSVNADILEKMDPEIIRVIHGARAEISEEYEIVGYSHVPITHVRLKDWDKFDLPKYPERFSQAEIDKKDEWNLNAFKSVRRWWGFDFETSLLDPADAENNSIERDLTNPVFTHRPEKTVYVMHAPPYGTSLDWGFGGYHVGSVAERLFIEQYQPHATLHGHIHGTVDRSGKFQEQIGRTMSLCSGNRPVGENIALVNFDLAHPQAAKRLII